MRGKNLQSEKLFYRDAYLRTFEAQVVARQRMAPDQPAVALDRTAFYPTGGGQPNDMGRLVASGDVAVQVTDVVADDGVIWHLLDRELDAPRVTGELDWRRRFDHMQQHTGQHVLSQAFVVNCDAETVAFHLGERVCTIDLDRVDLDAAALARVEAAANAVIDAALPVSASFVTPEELAQLPLRRPPKVSDDVRIVQVEGFDWSPCGGTHVANTSQIGLIKVTGAERRGSEVRITFLCGQRARADYARLKTLAQGLVARYMTAEDDVLDLLDRRAAEADQMRKELADLERQWAETTAAALWAEAPQRGSLRVVTAALDGSIDRVKKVAQALRARPGVVVCLGARGERPQLVVTRSDDVVADAGALLRVAAAAGGGRGGGRPDWAQGGVPSDEALGAAFDALLHALHTTREET